MDRLSCKDCKQFYQNKDNKTVYGTCLKYNGTVHKWETGSENCKHFERKG